MLKLGHIMPIWLVKQIKVLHINKLAVITPDRDPFEKIDLIYNETLFVISCTDVTNYIQLCPR